MINAKIMEKEANRKYVENLTLDELDALFLRNTEMKNYIDEDFYYTSLEYNKSMDKLINNELRKRKINKLNENS